MTAEARGAPAEAPVMMTMSDANLTSRPMIRRGLRIGRASSARRPRLAFTLIELLVVIVIIGLLIGLAAVGFGAFVYLTM